MAVIVCCSISGIANIVLIVLNTIWYFNDIKQWEKERDLEIKEHQEYLDYMSGLFEDELQNNARDCRHSSNQ